MYYISRKNKNYICLKKDIKELFSKMENYTLKSIYDETLRGRIDCSRLIERKNDKTQFKIKKLYHRPSGKEINLKKQILFIPNILDFVCPDCLREKNKAVCIERLLRFFYLICNKRDIKLNKNHALILLLTWERIGRWRSINKSELLNYLEDTSHLCNMEIELLLKDLWKTGFLIDFLDSYGIKEKLVL